MFSLRRCLRLDAAALAAALMLPAGCANHAPAHHTALQTLPLPQASSVTDTYFGTSVADPYRALVRISEERDRPFRHRDRRIRERDRSFR
jgi:hypothetical protein